MIAAATTTRPTAVGLRVLQVFGRAAVSDACCQSRQRDVVGPYVLFDRPTICASSSMESSRVLVVEDEPYMARRSAVMGRLEAIAADIAGDGDTALELLSISAYDIAVSTATSLGPPVTRSPRASSPPASMPILMLTAADRLDDKASGFELGADDYLTKPFELQELVLGLKALDRRRGHNRPPVREIAGLRLDPFRREVYRDGRYVALTRKQFAVLEVLVAAEGGAVSAEAPGTGMGRERRPLHQRRAHHGLSPAQAPRRTLADRHGARRRPASTQHPAPGVRRGPWIERLG